MIDFGPVLLRRVMGKVEHDASGCWLWRGMKRDGYGRLRVDGRLLAAHRISYLMFRGPIPDGMGICHSCDVPACVNPAHLWPGTQKDNMADAARKSRMDRTRKAKGYAHYKAKLSPEQITAIRADHRTQRAIAADFGIAQQTVSRIRRGERWA